MSFTFKELTQFKFGTLPYYPLIVLYLFDIGQSLPHFQRINQRIFINNCVVLLIKFKRKPNESKLGPFKRIITPMINRFRTQQWWKLVE